MPRVSLCAEQLKMEQQVVLCLKKTGPHISDPEGCDLTWGNPLFQVFSVSWYTLQVTFHETSVL